MSRQSLQHAEILKKKEEDYDYEGEFLLSEKYPKHWALLADEGYQGAYGFLRYVTPHKKPERGVLNKESLEFNRKHSDDRIPVENYFGRMGKLRSILPTKYVCAEDT